MSTDMQLILEILDPAQRQQVQTPRMCFGQTGGLIGRSPQADWVLADALRHVSGQHARISWQDGRFWLTDVSRNGTVDLRTGTRLPKGVAQPVASDACYRLGSLTLHARLLSAADDGQARVGRAVAAGGLIPDDAFLLNSALGRRQSPGRVPSDLDEPLFGQQLPPAVIDREQLHVPRLLPGSIPLEPPGAAFWQAYATALGVCLDGMDQAACEQLALDGAALLRQSLMVQDQACAFAGQLRLIRPLHCDFQS